MREGIAAEFQSRDQRRGDFATPKAWVVFVQLLSEASGALCVGDHGVPRILQRLRSPRQPFHGDRHDGERLQFSRRRTTQSEENSFYYSVIVVI